MSNASFNEQDEPVENINTQEDDPSEKMLD